MSKWYKPLLLSSLLTIPWGASAHNECDDEFKSSDRLQRQIEFMDARDRLIGHFSPEKNATLIASVIRESTAASQDKAVPHALWLQDVPKEVIRHAKALGLTEERALEVAGDIENEINVLEKKAICYHFADPENYRGTRLMMLKLYEDLNVAEDDTDEKPIAFGYITTTFDGNSGGVVHMTYPGDCSNRLCHFTNIDKDQFKGTGIRLVHHPEEVETMVTKLSNVVNGDPVVTDLTALTLNKTGELFTKPEVYVVVHYYDEDVEVDKKSYDRRMMIDIPWALKEGENYGRKRLLTWGNQTKAHLVIMEDDRDIPFRDLQKVVKLGFRAAKTAIELIPGASGVFDFAEALSSIVKSNDTGGDEELLSVLQGWQKNDYIDELVLEIGFDQNKPQHGIKGNAILQLSNMYAEKEVTAESTGDAAAAALAEGTAEPADTISEGDSQVPPSEEPSVIDSSATDTPSEAIPSSSEEKTEGNTEESTEGKPEESTDGKPEDRTSDEEDDESIGADDEEFEEDEEPPKTEVDKDSDGENPKTEL